MLFRQGNMADILGHPVLNVYQVEILATMINRIRDGDSSRRLIASNELAKMGAIASSAVPALVSALIDFDIAVRWSAANALMSIGPEAYEAIAQLIDTLQDSSIGVRTAAAYALRRIGHRSIAPLIKEISSSLRERRVNAMYALACIGAGARQALPALVKALQDPDPVVRSAASDAIRRIDMDSASTVTANFPLAHR